MPDDIKQIQITGGAELVGGRKKRLSKKRDKGLPIGPLVSKQEGGTCGSPGYVAPMQTTAAPLADAFKLLTPAGQNPLDITKVAVAAMPGPGLMQGGAKRKIELRKSVPTKKVHLHSKKAVVPVPSKPLHKKKTRKIVLGLVSLQKRQTRAKKISEKMKEMPIDKLKKQLVEQGLIKNTSKAPESVLRQIAADAQIVGGNGL
jgi:hypothetical protein